MNRKTKYAIAVGATVCVLVLLTIPTFIRAWSTPASNACINNLRLIDAAKQQWALEKQQTNGAVVAWSDLVPYIGRMPKCPNGGVYSVGKIGELPKCSIEGDTLPH